MLLLLASSAALAACGAEIPDLRLGDTAWFVEDASWNVGPATAELTRGFGFPVLLDGVEVGRIYAGEARQVTHPGASGDALRAILAAELPAVGTVDAAGDWSLGADVVWRLGGDVAQASEGWHRIHAEHPVIYDLDAPVQPTILVVGYRELDHARAVASAALAARSASLPDAGHPLRSLLLAGAARPGEPWGLLEARTGAKLGRLAGFAANADDPWLTTLQADPILDDAVGAATIALGSRALDGYRALD